MVEQFHALGLRVVAEGIETAKASDALATLGCDDGQGFLWRQIMRAADLPSPA